MARDHLTAWTGWAVCRVRRDIASRRAGSAPGRGKGQLRTTGLANGTYTGQSTGFYAPLNVEIKVANGMLAGVRVVKHREDRPRNALDGFVKRLKGPAPLAIDAVTGATQTCHGVLLAAEEALRKAAPRGLQTLSQTQ